VKKLLGFDNENTEVLVLGKIKKCVSEFTSNKKLRAEVEGMLSQKTTNRNALAQEEDDESK
jgi:hypothetical protein